MIRLGAYLQTIFTSKNNIFETLMDNGDWEHCTYGQRDYAPDVLQWIIDKKEIHFKDDYVNGDKLEDIFDLEKISNVLNRIQSGKITSKTDFDDCLKNKNDKKHLWTKIDKTYFRKVCYSKQNQGNKFEHEYEKMLNDNTNKMLSNIFCFLSSYNDKDNTFKSEISISTSLDGSNNSKRSISNFDEDGQELDYITIKNAKSLVGETLSDITLTLKSSDDKPVVDPVTGLDKLFLSLKSGSTISLINPGVRNISGLPIKNYIFNYNDVQDIKTFEVPFGSLGKTLLKTFNINPVCFAYIFNNRRIQEGSIVPDDTIRLIDNDELYKSLSDVYGNVEKTNRGFVVDVTDYGKKIHDLIKLVIGSGYVIVHKLQNGKIHFIDLRDDKLVKDLIGDNIKSAKIIFPYIGTAEKGNKTAARVVVSVYVNDNISIEVTFRSTKTITKDDPYPTHMAFMYTISNKFQEDRQNFNINKEIKNELIDGK